MLILRFWFGQGDDRLLQSKIRVADGLKLTCELSSIDGTRVDEKEWSKGKEKEKENIGAEKSWLGPSSCYSFCSIFFGLNTTKEWEKMAGSFGNADILSCRIEKSLWPTNLPYIYV